MATSLSRLAALVLAAIASCSAVAREETHARLFVEHLALYSRARECSEPKHLCSEMRQRVESAACDPPFIRLSFTPKKPIIVRGRVDVGSNGKVRSVTVTRTSHIRALDEAIVESLSECRLAVLMKDGTPVGSSFEVEWSMQDNTTTISIPNPGS